MDSHKEIKAGVGYTIGNILIKGISFISLPVFSRLMSSSEYGYFNTYVAYEAILAIILGVGMHASIKNAQYDFKEEQAVFVSTQAIIVLLTTIIVGVIYFVFQIQINSFTGFSTQIMTLLILQSFGAAMLNIVNSKLSLNYDYKSYLWYAAFNTIVNFLLSVILILTVMADNRLLGRVIGAATPLLLIGVYSFLGFEKRVSPRFDKRMAKYALAFGFPLVWHYLSQQIQSQFDRIMITNLVDASSTGIYSFVYTIANIFQILFYSTDNVWGVWMFKQLEKKDYAMIRAKSKQYMLLISCIACCMIVVSRELIMIMGPETYWSGANLFIPIIVGMYFLFIYTIPVGVEYFYKETKYIGATTLLAAIVNVITNYIFIRQYGYQAAAYTTLLSYVLMFILHWFISGKVLNKHSQKKFLAFKDFALYIAVVVTVGAVTIVLNPYPIAKYFFSITVLSFAIWHYKDMWIPYVKSFLKRNK